MKSEKRYGGVINRIKVIVFYPLTWKYMHTHWTIWFSLMGGEVLGWDCDSKIQIEKRERKREN